eukprot:704618_1
MNLLIIQLASHNIPLKEGSALALIMINQIINLFNHNTEESKALQALKNNQKQTIQLNQSSNQKTQTETQTNPPIASITPSNIHVIDTQNIPEFSSKTIEMIHTLQKLQCNTWKFKIVSSDFYEQTLEYRAKNILNAPINQLCKSLLMKNKKCIYNNCDNRLNSKYYLVVFQYNHKIKTQKLKKKKKKKKNNN